MDSGKPTSGRVVIADKNAALVVDTTGSVESLKEFDGIIAQLECISKGDFKYLRFISCNRKDGLRETML